MVSKGESPAPPAPPVTPCPTWPPPWLASPPTEAPAAVADPPAVADEAPADEDHQDPADKVTWEDCIVPPPPCPACGLLELWQDGTGTWRCLRCDPPTKARLLQRKAARLRRLARRQTEEVGEESRP
jgi:ribosomal protein L37AE/L43A